MGQTPRDDATKHAKLREHIRGFLESCVKSGIHLAQCQTYIWPKDPFIWSREYARESRRVKNIILEESEKYEKK